MTNADPKSMRPGAPSSGGAAFASMIESVRPSIVAIESAIGSGSGYCALANRVIVTSRRVVGYERDVLITTNEGIVVPGIVVRVNVALDIALLIPTDAARIPPIKFAPAPPKLGDPVALVGRVGAEPVARVTSVSARERAFDGLPHVQVDTNPDLELSGAALVDSAGRLIGSLVRARKRADGAWAQNLVLPLSAFEGGLMSVEGSEAEIQELVAEYGCPRCDTVFEPGLDRCLECGVLLPHPWSEAFDPSASVHVQRRYSQNEVTAPERLALHAVRVALLSVGIPANRARIGPLLWRFSTGDPSRDAHVDLTVDDRGEFLVLRAEVARIPDSGFEHFYRHLLAQNGETTGPFRLGLGDSTAVLSLFEPVTSISRDTFPARVDAFVTELLRCQECLARYFGAEAIVGG